MKQLKTAELTGAALDWAVAKCETPSGRDNHETFLRDYLIGFSTAYSTTWSQGGPIIEREGISLVYVNGTDLLWSAIKYTNFEPWVDGSYHLPTGKERSYTGDGPTPLIAAMRCFVASRLGDVVEVPDELA
jgi:Protein of unknown function (DUF2591)